MSQYMMDMRKMKVVMDFVDTPGRLLNVSVDHVGHLPDLFLLTLQLRLIIL